MIIEADEKLFMFLNGLHSGFLDIIMWHISGKYIWLTLYVVLLYAIIKKYRQQGFLFILGIVLTIVIADQTSVFIKNSVERLRPTHNPDFGNIVHVVRNYRGGNYGFVSSHAANCFGLATFIALIFKKQWITASMLVWAIIVSYSRIYLGVHYPGDIICGGILGSTIAFVLFFISNKLVRKLT